MIFLTHKELIGVLEREFPLYLAESWDNTGLQVGPFDDEIRRIGVALNPSLRTLYLAVEKGCNFLLTHHPLILTGLRRVDLSGSIGKVINLAILKKITIYSIHTPWDSALGGGNDYWADLLGLENRNPIVPLRENPQTGIGRVGEVYGTSFYDMVSFLKKEVRFLIPVFSGKDKIYKVALCTGSGGDLLEKVISLRVDVYITCDLKYHQILNALYAGLNLIILSHHEMEEKSLFYLERRLRDLLPSLGLEILKEEDPFLG
ncbi:MAG: Nif3-like dinuclear metal center hexameric protein [Synergistetes bacterium]|nr:Nif3-like dinuclear metal center hexameric protein [Synergistota bacterium]MCX8127503.1 Nif3-like dinuclear metal center hexameric protein [Synergistota bacterium]MDW8191581.1 Nif3-like dinuclear metal center hexameric protein [Synergistota bacterium]